MKCSKCLHWQCSGRLRDYREWGDCYRVVTALEPNLGCCYETNENDMIEKFFEVPFDPHDVKYWRFNELWMKMYTHLTECVLPEGVRVIEETRDDVVFDQKNGERIGRLKLHYFQTRKDYDCKGETDEDS